MFKQLQSFQKKLFSISLITFSFYALSSSGQGACGFTVNAGNDTFICSPAIIPLNGNVNVSAANIQSISWSPTAGLSTSTILNPTANITSSITYNLIVTAISDSNLIVNGSFTNGNSGFFTSYVPGTGGAWGLLTNPGTCHVNTNPNLDHSNFAVFGDHTTGTGNMFICNGDSGTNSSVWCEIIQVTPNTNYNFSAWAASCVIDNPAILQFSINGTLLGTPFYLPGITGLWTQFSQTWNSGSLTSINICIYDQNVVVGGNDFALDDISFNPICTIADAINISLFPQPVAPSIYQGGDTLYATSGFNGYQWFLGSTLISGATNYFHVAQQSGNYNLVVTDSNGCQVGAGILNVIAGIYQANKDEKQLTIYPSPVFDNLFVSGSLLNGNTSIFEIYNSIGEKVYSDVIKAKESTINVSAYSRGIYLLKITSGDSIISKQFIIDR